MKRKHISGRKKEYILSILLSAGVVAASISGCGGDSGSTGAVSTPSAAPSVSKTQDDSPSPAKAPASEPAAERVKGSRDNTPVCLVPEASGETVYENDRAHIDASHVSDGYIVVRYIGPSNKVKLQITGPNEITYTYDLTTGTPKDEVFPLQSGNGDYMVNVFENKEGTQYTQAFSQLLEVNITDEFSPFLYPNQYVDFTPSSQAIKKGEELAYGCNSDLEVVSEVYNYIITNITYDHELAENVGSGYLPDVEKALSTKTGICLDYAALMTTMLRTQRIPTRMEIGYAGTAYHAWLSTYIKDVGWVNGMIEFDGKDWSLMDPTFASNLKDKQLKEFIGDGSNYSVQFIY
ncbi:MAG: transglutaminase domain-containing protein [Butyrivibrio sp.]|nr:transglutaminase domain-containing protein [Butyrivibrio sp.]